VLTDKQHAFLQALNDMLVEYRTLPVDDRGPYVELNVIPVRVPLDGTMVMHAIGDSYVQSMWTPAAPIDSHRAIDLSFRIYPDQFIDSTAEDVRESIDQNSKSGRIAVPQSRQLPGAKRIGSGNKPSELTGLPQPQDTFKDEE
jgi:hypothetical protein